jgi:hypothetical protein
MKGRVVKEEYEGEEVYEGGDHHSTGNFILEGSLGFAQRRV